MATDGASPATPSYVTNWSRPQFLTHALSSSHLQQITQIQRSIRSSLGCWAWSAIRQGRRICEVCGGYTNGQVDDWVGPPTREGPQGYNKDQRTKAKDAQADKNHEGFTLEV